MNNKAWFPERFSELAKQNFILKSAYKQRLEHAVYINFLYSPPFSNTFYLQMYYQGGQLHLSKSIIKDQDPKSEHVLIEQATLSGTLVNQLLRLIKKAAWPIFSTEENGVVWRDGVQAELCVGRGFHETNFSWWLGIDPVDWGDLDILAHKILEINKEAEYSVWKKEYFEILIEESSTSLTSPRERSLLLTYREVDV
jgi:hypothetical protein